MQRHDSYSYPQYVAPTTHKYSAAHSTSSAFSASANPNEDWTKISDLAERRRIQNRIAQRNYRKKLKKRLEDLERRAASNSASPEQHHEDFDTNGQEASVQEQSAAGAGSARMVQTPSPEMLHQHQYLPSQDDRSMFSHQYTRQLSTSPPPFSYSTYPTTEHIAYAPYPQHAPYHAISVSSGDMPMFSPYLPPLPASYPGTLPSMVYPTKQDYFAEEELTPFGMNYASMAGMDIPQPAHSYQDSNAHVTLPNDPFYLLQDPSLQFVNDRSFSL